MHPEFTDLWFFFVLVFGVIALPGMDMAFVAGSTLTAGWRGGTAAVAGVVAGGLVHLAVGATGVAALLLMWPAAFNALLLAGAAYMAWIGWTLLRASAQPAAPPGADAGPSAPTAAPMTLPTPPRSHHATFGRAMLTCLLNPKAYAFMLAVFPAFMAAPGQAVLPRVILMGAIIAVTQVLVYGTVAALVLGARQWVGGGPGTQRWALRTVGLVLIGGAVLALPLAWRPASADAVPAHRAMLPDSIHPARHPCNSCLFDSHPA
jgi:threonine/homoserine/homoserine lactone efflux protein